MPEVIRLLHAAGVGALAVVGGIIPSDDAAKLRANGVAAVYTPKDFELAGMIDEVTDLVDRYRGACSPSDP